MFNFPIYPRYSFGKIGLVAFLISFISFLWSYISKMIVDEVFNWVGYIEYLPNQIISTAVLSVFYFYSLNKFHYLRQKGSSYSEYVLPIVIGTFFLVAHSYLLDKYLPLTNNLEDPIPTLNLFFAYFLFAFVAIGFAFLIVYINNLREVRRKHKLLEQQKLKLEVEKAQAELMFLKSQINPHFLHNTLNSFYARSLSFSKELADGILTLSEIMRYALEEAHTQDGKVFIKKEVEHVRNLIKLNQFRFRNNLQIQMEVKGLLNGYVIIPFVLITLVENIFKHGDLSNNNDPIKILIGVEKGSFSFYSCNKKKQGPKELSTGIGLDNIKKRLEFAYGENYQFNVKENGDTYITELIIYKL